MSILTRKLPEGIVIEGRFYPVYTDFKNWLKISEILEEERHITPSVLSRIFALSYKILPETADEAFSGVLRFLSCGKKTEEKEEGGRNKSRIFSFGEDAELIYAAFFSQYGIDLYKASMHWFLFCALFSSLEERHKLFEVINIRAAKLTDIKDKQKRAYFAKMKRKYSLKDRRTEEEMSEDIAKSMEAGF